MAERPPALKKAVTLRGRRFFLRVETSADSSAYAKYDGLRQAIWGFADDHLAGARNMMCENYLHEGGSLFLSASTEAGELVGFAYGFVGVKDKALAFKSPDNLWFYAQYAGVLPAWQGCGLGQALKEFQGEVVSRELGIFEVVCTFDPLTGVNARRNIHHFGMNVLEYRAATYGEYGGFLNRLDVPTDRFFMSWDLRTWTSRPAAAGASLLGSGRDVLNVKIVRIAGRSGEVEIERPGKADLSEDQAVRVVRIPADFYLMLRETDVADPSVRKIPVEWREATRRIFQDSLAKNFKVVDFLPLPGPAGGQAYVLRRG